MDGEHLRNQSGEQELAQNPTIGIGEARIPAGSSVSATGTSSVQSVFPEAAQQVIQELIDLPGQILPAETVSHLKNAGRETLLALYSLWQNINRATSGAPEEKVRKRIEVE
jgi:hypothetical protein